MATKVISIVGQNGAGKDTAGAVLSHLIEITTSIPAPVVPISSPLRNYFQAKGLSPTREQLIEYNRTLTASTGPAALAHRVLEEHGDAQLLIVTGPRQLEQLTYFDTHALHVSIAVVTAAATRYHRLTNSNYCAESGGFYTT